jgi:hypothetical protein
MRATNRPYVYMQSSTCKQEIKPFGKRDEAMYKSATTLLAARNISLQMGGDHISNVWFSGVRRISWTGLCTDTETFPVF